jgi:ATP-dependent RNA helicase SUPV3L1/SUV3
MRRGGRTRFDLDGSDVTAVLGPTNTGKTHLALSTLAAAPSGMIGLPLRLLAREAYERLKALKGADRVALVTGEEKRVPPNARWFACTVEAMPVDRPVDVVAVDEVQLVHHPTRGHHFTDRVLHARGTSKTLFLGSDTATSWLKGLFPTLSVTSRPRLSTLRPVPPTPLRGVPPRSAIIAFSIERVYELAERVRARHGGVAVVLGALSPRARQAQVELFESGEVDHLVATDAIGMGLNLAVDHVAFADVAKFDGRSRRALTAAELAQIAGRAGRHTRDGTFSTIEGECDLPDDVVEQVASHRFEPIPFGWWRRPDPDTTSVEALIATLRTPPPHPSLRPIRDAEDEATLHDLLRRDDVRGRATSPDRVRALWEVAQVPDYRKTLTDAHGNLLAGVYRDLVDHGVVRAEDVELRLDRLDRVEGDLDALLTRVAWVRTWSFLANRPGWLEDAHRARERAAQIEDRLSDAIHRALVERFVERSRKKHLPTTVEGDRVVRAGAVLGRMDGLLVRGADGLHGAEKADLAALLEARAQALVASPDGAFGFDGDTVTWEGARVGVVSLKGRWDVDVRPVRIDWLTPESRRQVAARLQAAADARIAALFEPIHREVGVLTPAGKALRYAVELGLGCVARGEVEDAARGLSEMDRRHLARMDVRIGALVVFVASRLDPASMATKAWLLALAGSAVRLTGAPPSISAHPDAIRLGYAPAGPVAVRADVAEPVAADLRRRWRERRPIPDDLPTRLGVDPALTRSVATALAARPP